MAVWNNARTGDAIARKERMLVLGWSVGCRKRGVGTHERGNANK
jgi:hypothetical protein